MMRPLPIVVLALAVSLPACDRAPGAAEPAPAAAATEAAAAPQSPAAPAAPAASAPDYVAGTGGPTMTAEPATDEVPTGAGTDAEDARYFDFSGAALERMRRDARPAPPALRDAARRLVDATGRERGCGTYPEGERLFVLDLDGRPGDEALLLYTMEGCGDGGNYYDRAGYVLRETGGTWTPAAEFALGTRLVGNATISALEPGLVVVTPDAGSQALAQRVQIPTP